VLKFYELLFTITKLSDEFVVDAVVAAAVIAAAADDDVTVVTDDDDAVSLVAVVTADDAASLVSVVGIVIVVGGCATERSIFISKTNINNEVSKDECLSMIWMLLSLLITK
jgi:hypothetical protein